MALSQATDQRIKAVNVDNRKSFKRVQRLKWMDQAKTAGMHENSAPLTFRLFSTSIPARQRDEAFLTNYGRFPPINGRKGRQGGCVRTKKKFMIGMISGLLGMIAFNVHAETAYYALDDVILDRGSRIDGFIIWTYTPGDFENGASQFIYLDIPNSVHNQDDLISIIEPSQIEITFDGNVHDDGVDIKMVLLQPLAPLTSSVINTNHAESKYSIGGNGLYDGFFLGGSVVPTNLTVVSETLGVVERTQRGAGSLLSEPRDVLATMVAEQNP